MTEKTSINRSKGFTLIELTIAITVVGLLMGSAIQSYNLYSKWKKVETTTLNLQKVEDALAAYVQNNGHYPCPAPINANPGDPNFGIATNCANPAVAGVTPVPGSNGRQVRIGALPSRTLGFSDSFMDDGWNQLFRYAVTTKLAQTPAAFDNRHGAITVKDTKNVTVANGNAHYVVISAGPDGKGAHSSRGAQMSNCMSALGIDRENCDNNATFVVDPKNRSFSSGANHYDDFASYRIYNDKSEVWRIMACNKEHKFYSPYDVNADLLGCTCPAGQIANAQGKCINAGRSGYKTLGSQSISLPNLSGRSGTLKMSIPKDATDAAITTSCNALGRNALVSMSADFDNAKSGVGGYDLCGMRGTGQGESTGNRRTAIVPIPPDARTLLLPYSSKRAADGGINGSVRFLQKQ